MPRDEFAFDVRVNITPAWVRPAESAEQQIARGQAEARYAALGHEIAEMVRNRLESMREDYPDSQWGVLPFDGFYPYNS